MSFTASQRAKPFPSRGGSSILTQNLPRVSLSSAQLALVSVNVKTWDSALKIWTVPPASDLTEAADLCQKLSLDSQQRTLEVPEVAEKPSTHKYGSIGGNVANVQFPTCERSTTPLPTDFMDPNMCSVPNAYSPYYYRGYDGPINKWEDYPRYVNTDGVEKVAFTRLDGNYFCLCELKS